MSWPGLAPLWLTAQLAGTATLVLLIIGAPLAWRLSQTRSRLQPVAESVIALPLVLPPTVLGFYLLVLFSPGNPVGGAWVAMTGQTLAFSFAGLVVASVVYSLPFAVQPLQAAFEAAGRAPMEAAASLRASPLDAFLSVASPMALRGYLTAAILSFAHTVGEFGVVLMIGGNIPGQTRVISIAIYERVEVLDYGQAHALSLILIGFSLAVLLAVYTLNRRFPLHMAR